MIERLLHTDSYYPVPSSGLLLEFALHVFRVWLRFSNTPGSMAARPRGRTAIGSSEIKQ